MAKWRPGALCSWASWLGLLLSGAASAQTAVGVISREGGVVPAGATQAFREGGQEEAPASTLAEPPTSAQEKAQERAAALLAQGERDYLNFKLPKAEKALSDAVGLYLESPAALVQAETAARAISLLAQLELSQKRTRGADEVLGRALSAFPGFPGDAPVPPDVAQRVKALQEARLTERAPRLLVTSGRSDLPVRVNGLLVGKTPVTLYALEPSAVRVALEPELLPAQLVGLREGESLKVHFPLGREEAVERVLKAAERGSSTETLEAALALESAAGVVGTCLVVVQPERALVINLEGRAVVGGHLEPVPPDSRSFRRLSRRCFSVGRDLSAQEATAALWPPPAQVVSDEGLTRGQVGWMVGGLGVGAAGLGLWLGLGAQAAADDYNRGGLATDKDAAESKALWADVSLLTAASLVATGLYLILTEPTTL